MLWWKLQRLKSKDAKTRRRVVEEMVATGEAAVVEPIGEALQDDDPEVRVTAARGLGTLKDGRALPQLTAALRDRKSEVRTAVVDALRSLGDNRAVEPLVRMLEDQDHSVRWHAAGALNALGWKPSGNTEMVLRYVALGQHENAAEHGSDSISILTKALSDTSGPRRNAAATALGKTGDPRALKPLEQALHDQDNSVRVAAVEALSQLGQPQSATTLLGLLRDKNHLVRAAAVEALGRLGDARVLEPIGKHLIRDESWDVRKLSVETLGRIGDPKAAELLWVGLKDADHDVRQTAAHALGQIPDPRSIGPLVLALKDENSAVRHAAKGALRQVDRNWELSPQVLTVMPQLEASVNDKEYWVAQSAADTLAKINDARQRVAENNSVVDPAKQKAAQAIAVLVDSLNDYDRDLRQACVEALGRMNDFSAIAPLVSAMDDPDECVGRTAALALNHLNWSPNPEDAHRVNKMNALILRT